MISQSWRLASSEAYWTVFEERGVAWQGFGQRSTSRGVVTLGGGGLGCWAKKQRGVALSSWEREFIVFSNDSGPASLGIQSELKDPGFSCAVIVAPDSQCVIDHLRPLWSQRCVEA